MGGMALPAVENYGVGYLQGASDAAKEMNVNVDVNYTYTGTFSESPDIKSKASSWYAGGTEVIFSCGGQICNSIFAAGQEAGKYTIGVDTDQSGDSDTVFPPWNLSFLYAFKASIVAPFTSFNAEVITVSESPL